jgi:hypothetical protein
MIFLAGNNFRYGALMRRVVGLSLTVVENLPSLKISFQLTRPQAMRGRLFARLRDVDD